MQAHLIHTRIITFFSKISYGILLGAIQLILLYLSINHLNVTTTIIVGMILYFVIPGMAGLRSARHSEPVAAGITAGFVTGLTCAIIIMLTLIILAIIASIVPPPPSPPTSRYIPISASSIIAYIIIMAFMLNLVGVMIALIGGALGGFIGRQWRAQPGRSD